MSTVMETKPKAVKDIFETEACSRCWGSGSYSYCQMYGTRCFKCAGSGWQFTKHGQQDYTRWREAVDAATVKPVVELKVGDFCKAWSDFRKFYKVVGIELANGQYNVTFDRDIKIPSPIGGAILQRSFNVPADGTVRIHPGNDAMPQAEAFVTPHYRRCKGCRKLYAEQPSAFGTCPACTPAAQERAEAARLEAERQEAERQAELDRLEAERQAQAAAQEAERAAKIAAQRAQSEYFGTPGKRETFTLTLKRIVPIEAHSYVTGRPETRYLHILADAQGNAAAWFTGSPMDAEEGAMVTVKATVKEHREYKGQRQTVLTRVAVLQEMEG